LKKQTKETHQIVVEVALPVPLRRTFDYRLSDDQCRVRPGFRVEVELQKRRMIGVVVKVGLNSNVPSHRLKAVSTVIDQEPTISPKFLRFLIWVSQYYHYPLGEVIQSALPSVIRKNQLMQPRLPARYFLTPFGQAALAELSKRAKVQQEILSVLKEVGNEGLLACKMNGLFVRAPTATLSLLQKRRWICTESRVEDYLLQGFQQRTPSLNPWQIKAIKQIKSNFFTYAPFLLQGVTGSGKTEIYLRIASSILKSGYQVLVLVPEIALTPQLLDRFQHGIDGKIAVMHSGLTDRDRHIAWWSAKQGLADVIIGTRSAVFAPLARPGLYIIDEEHDLSYKQQDGFRYHARDLIVKRAHQDGVPVVLGSATPSFESIDNVHRKRYHHLQLQGRAGGAILPSFQLLDLTRLPTRFGITAPVIHALQERLDRQEQSIVYVNRRGFAPVYMCVACSWQARCTRCEIRLTLHKTTRHLLCHHCGQSRTLPKNCPDCGHTNLHPVGEGTQRIEDALKEELPTARIMRFDSDAINSSIQFETILSQVREGEVDVLVGTQLLGKGHDFPAVTLVCILNADSGLYSIDFRSTERLYQQLTQVAGRAGRAEKPGQVLVQTRYPDDASFIKLSKNDFDGFVKSELSQRRLAECPPFKRFALLRADSAIRDASLKFVSAAAASGRRKLKALNEATVQIFDPVPSPMERKAGRYRAQLLVTSVSQGSLHDFLDQWIEDIEKLKERRLSRWSLDVDPMEMY
tara:strand:+ start:21834 stop:24071 length:2238 start_codon:yes stop_codon:yes gene_type:complete